MSDNDAPNWALLNVISKHAAAIEMQKRKVSQHATTLANFVTTNQVVIDEYRRLLKERDREERALEAMHEEAIREIGWKAVARG